MQHMVLELRDAKTGRCVGSRMLKLGFEDEMKDAEGFGFISRELWKDAKRAYEQNATEKS